MWKRGSAGKYERDCRHCLGTGKEELHARHFPCCPNNGNMEVVEHPANSSKEDMKDFGIAHHLERCNDCGNIWMTYFECQDDSWDVPGPELIGKAVPPDEWRLEKKT